MKVSVGTRRGGCNVITTVFKDNNILNSKSVDIVMSNLDDETARELKSLFENVLIKQRRRNRYRDKDLFSWTIKIG